MYNGVLKMSKLSWSHVLVVSIVPFEQGSRYTYECLVYSTGNTAAIGVVGQCMKLYPLQECQPDGVLTVQQGERFGWLGTWGCRGGSRGVHSAALTS